MKKKAERQIVFLTSLLALIFLVCIQFFSTGHSLFEKRFAIWFFDVGQGDSIFVESPSGFQMLVDGGPDNVVLDKLDKVMPFWDRTIDAIVLTHPHADHLNGLVDVLHQYHVKTVYLTNVEFYTPNEQAFQDALQYADQKIEVTQPFDIDLGEETFFHIIYPTTSFVGQLFDDLNESSIVGLLKHGENSVLLTGDAPADIEPAIAAAVDQPVDVLKVGHHGSAYSSTEKFLQAIAPTYAAISVGEGNSYGHPSLLTLKRLQEVGVKIFRTDLSGDVLCLSDSVTISCQPQ